jgi:cell division protein FtsW (lipid II flippase)
MTGMKKPFRILLPTASVLIMGFLAIIFYPYHMERVSAFLDPWDAPRHTNEQLAEALTTFGQS